MTTLRFYKQFVFWKRYLPNGDVMFTIIKHCHQNNRKEWSIMSAVDAQSLIDEVNR